MTTKRIIILIFSLFILVGYGIRENNDRTLFFPKVELKPGKVPDKENVWVFILAGQSNMAGRGLVEPQDTIPNERVFTINKNGNLIIAKEPLHFYEPSMTGLDCGLSFGKALTRLIPDSISVMLIPTAVGGSSISQWLGDSTHRNVKLLTNFKEKAEIGMNYGQIKGILWHQGESDATSAGTIEIYENQLKKLIELFRNEVVNLSLSVLIGELGSFPDNNDGWQAINEKIREYAKSDSNAYIIRTDDLKDKGDKVHFNSEGQREIGRRFAEEFIKMQ